MTELYGRKVQLLVGGPPLAVVSTAPGTATAATVAGAGLGAAVGAAGQAVGSSAAAGTQTVAGSATLQGLDLSQLAIHFSVTHASTQTPKTAAIRIWNMARTTYNKLKKEYSRVVLNAGYQAGQYGNLFDGTIKQVRFGRENSIDTYVDILAAEGDLAYTQATVSGSVAAGKTPGDLFKTAAAGYAPYGVGVDSLPAGLFTTKYPRGRVIHGMVRDILREIAWVVGGQVYFSNGKVGVNLPGSTPARIAVVVNSQSGMIGVPIQTQEGIIVRCLLNPAIQPNTILKMNNNDITLAPQSTAYTQSAQNETLPGLDPNGLYKVWFVDHTGATRENEFYSEMVTSAVDQSVQQPLGGATLLAIPGAGQ